MFITEEIDLKSVKNQNGAGKRIFIGSSELALEKAWCIQTILKELGANADVWDRVFTPGRITINELIAKTREYDGAVFVLAPDDKIEKVYHSQDGSNLKNADNLEPTVSYIPRDNVLVEAGMFMGVLGTEAVALCEIPGVWRTSDFCGITRVIYDVRNRDAMQESFRKWLKKGVIAGRRSSTSIKARKKAEKELSFEDMFGIFDESYHDITAVKIMNLASNIFLNTEVAIESQFSYQNIGLSECIQRILEERKAQVELMLLEPNLSNLADVESKIANDRLDSKAELVRSAWEALFDKIEQDPLYKKSVKTPSTFRYYAMKIGMPIGIINVEFEGENSYRNFVHVDLYTAALDTESNRRVINIWERQDPDNYQFFVRNFDNIKNNKDLCERMPDRNYIYKLMEICK